MKKWRIRIGEWAHVIADKILPIPGYAKGGIYVGRLKDYVLLDAIEIVEGRDIVQESYSNGISIQQAKDNVEFHAKAIATARLIRAASEHIQWSVVTHGNKKRVYYEIRGSILVKKLCRHG